MMTVILAVVGLQIATTVAVVGALMRSSQISGEEERRADSATAPTSERHPRRAA